MHRRPPFQARQDELAALFAEGSITAAQLKRGTAKFSTAVDSLDSELAAAAQGNPVGGFMGGSQPEKRWAAASPDIRGKIIDQLMVVTVTARRWDCVGSTPTTSTSNGGRDD